MKKLINEILCELRRMEQLSPNEISQEWQKEHDFPMPSMISSGEGHGIIISPKIDDYIREICKLYLQENPHLKSTYTDLEFLKLMQRAIGLGFASLDLDNSDKDNLEIIVSQIETVIKKDGTSFDDWEYAFGCTLFTGENNKTTLSIGPVRFEHRFDWLDRKNKMVLFLQSHIDALKRNGADKNSKIEILMGMMLHGKSPFMLP